MWEGSSSLIESTRERIFGPRKVTFNNGLRMEVSVNGPEPSVVLRSNKEVLLDFRSFAPPNTVIKFDPKGKWGVYPGDVYNSPVLQIGKFKGADAILDFLHECGHLQDAVLTDLALTADKRYTENYFRKSPSRNPERLKFLKESKELVLRSERNAWAFGLKNTRQLERQFGINIITQIGGIDGVRRYINSAFRSYERTFVSELEYLGFEIYSKKEMEEIFRKIN